MCIRDRGIIDILVNNAGIIKRIPMHEMKAEEFRQVVDLSLIHIFEAELNGEKRILKAGDCFYIEANVPHGLVSLEDGGVILDIFTPMREDFIG